MEVLCSKDPREVLVLTRELPVYDYPSETHTMASKEISTEMLIRYLCEPLDHTVGSTDWSILVSGQRGNARAWPPSRTRFQKENEIESARVYAGGEERERARECVQATERERERERARARKSERESEKRA